MKRFEVKSARIYRNSGAMYWNWEVVTELGTMLSGCTIFEWGARREICKALKFLQHCNIGIVEEYELFKGGEQE